MSRERERYDEIGKKIKRESDAAAVAALVAQQGGGRRQIQLGAPGILNTITPCAACKLLRRRCAQECPFSPYFSPHEPHKFASVHKVFGASNVSKLLMEVPENQRADAANSLVYEANVRLRDPVYGCMGAISALQQQLQVLQAELNAIRAEILKYKYRDNINNVSNISNININTTTNNNTSNSNSSNNNSINNNAATSHVSFFSTTTGVVSLATQSPPPPPPPPPPAPPLRDPPNSSVSSSMYTQQQQQQQQQQQPSGGNNDYSSISNENISYFG